MVMPSSPGDAFGLMKSAIRDNNPVIFLEQKGLWNYLIIEEDGSFGVHNYQFSVALLQLTEEALTFGVLDASSIASITDVPNDQIECASNRCIRAISLPEHVHAGIHTDALRDGAVHDDHRR